MPKQIRQVKLAGGKLDKQIRHQTDDCRAFATDDGWYIRRSVNVFEFSPKEPFFGPIGPTSGGIWSWYSIPGLDKKIVGENDPKPM